MFFGFEFDKGRKVAVFVFYALAFDELVAKVPYPFIHDMAGSCSFTLIIRPAPNLGFFVHLKSGGKKECLVTYHGRQRTFRSLI